MTSFEQGDLRPFDPASVPAYPLLRAVIGESAEGDFEGYVDDALVGRDLDLEPVRIAVIAAAVAVARKRTGAHRAVRMRGVAPDGASFNLVVTDDGEVIDVTDTKPTNRKPSGSSGMTRSSRRHRRLVVAGFVVASLTVFGAPVGLLVSGALSDDETVAVAPPPPRRTELPVVAPPMYSSVASWSVPLGTGSFATPGSAIDVDAQHVYAARDGGKELVAFDVATGLEAWVADGPSGAIATQPALMTLDGRPALGVASSTELLLLEPANGSRIGSWDLPTGSLGVSLTATGPVVRVDATHAQVVVDDELVTRVLPATGEPVAPGRDGSLIVVGDDGLLWQVVGNSVAGGSTQLPRVKGGEFAGVAGWTGDALVLAYRSQGGVGTSEVRLVGVEAGEWSKQWASRRVAPAYGTVGRNFDLMVAPSEQWGVYGETAIDLGTGDLVELPSGWQVTAISDERAFGVADGRPQTVARSGTLPDSDTSRAPVANVVAPQGAVGTLAFLVVDEPSERRLFALAEEEGE